MLSFLLVGLIFVGALILALALEVPWQRWLAACVAVLALGADADTILTIERHTEQISAQQVKLESAEQIAADLSVRIQRLGAQTIANDETHRADMDDLARQASDALQVQREQITALTQQITTDQQAIQWVWQYASKNLTAAGQIVQQLQNQVAVDQTRIADLKSQSDQIQDAVAKVEPRGIDQETAYRLADFARTHPGKYMVVAAPGISDGAALYEKVSAALKQGGIGDVQFQESPRVASSGELVIAAPSAADAQALATIFVPVDQHVEYAEDQSVDQFTIYLGPRV